MPHPITVTRTDDGSWTIAGISDSEIDAFDDHHGDRILVPERIAAAVAQAIVVETRNNERTAWVNTQLDNMPNWLADAVGDLPNRDLRVYLSVIYDSARADG